MIALFRVWRLSWMQIAGQSPRIGRLISLGLSTSGHWLFGKGDPHRYQWPICPMANQISHQAGYSCARLSLPTLEIAGVA